MYVRGQRAPEGTSTLMERPERVAEVSAGERLGRGGGRRQQAQGSVQREAGVVTGGSAAGR